MARNLAIDLAREFDQTTLLVECDLRQPRLATHFGMGDAPGLSDYLTRDAPLSELLVHPSVGRVVMLPGGTPQRDRVELLGSPRMKDLVKELKSRYASRIVIFDLPPLLAAADALAFVPNVEAALLVVEDGRTRRDDVRRAASLLGPARLIGTVLNKTTEPIASA